MLATWRSRLWVLWSIGAWSAACGGDADAGAQLGADASATQANRSTVAGSISSSGVASPAAAAGTVAATPARPASSGGAGAPAASPAGSAGSPAAGNAGSSATPSAAGGAGSNAAVGGASGASEPAAAGSGALPPPPDPVKPTWKSCNGFECSTLEVPLDYAAPSGEKIKLALKRSRARGQRIGSLLINPGGPGGSAVDFLTSFVQVAGPALLQRFDVVAFDPRGVGASTPIECHSTLQKLIATDPSPDDEAEWQASDAAAKVFADECAQKYGKILPFLGTVNVARDMDQVRAALGDEKLTYLGFSYGTAIGARYADLFPQRVRALVLDGALDMSLSALDISLQQAQGFEQALATYFTWCGRAASNCTWTSGMQPEAAFKQLAANVEKKALSGRVPVGPGEFLLGVIAPLYGGEDGFRILSQELTGAARGDGSTIMSLVDSYTDRKADGSYGNMQEANNAVNCIDAPAPDYMALRAQEMRFSMESPIFGTATLTSLFVCAHWPVHAQQAPVPRASGAPPILVVGTTGDPATPYGWAQALSKELESGVLLTYEGEGHTAYSRSVPCIDDAVEAYLIDGKVPEAGKRCASAGTASRSMLQTVPARGLWPTPRW
jgi:pimeloyl-ACP methyl ester carboxylesterase